MAGPKAAKKKKQRLQKPGVDFKKVKRKIGKKLPPPKNATSTQIKSKAIIVPEQSVATEKPASATSKKGLMLEDLLKQTSHHNSKVRRDALAGIRELIFKHPGELKRHKFALIEKLSQRIGDDDWLVREPLYQLVKLVILKEDIQGPLLSRMMAYIFNAMTHFSMEVRLLAFKFLDLVVQNVSSCALFFAEEILQNYEHILRSNLFNVQDKGKVKDALLGLIHCLLLLHSRQEDDWCEKNSSERDFLHGYWLNNHANSVDFYLIINKLKDLVPVLIIRLLELLPPLRSMDSLGLQSLDTMLYTLQCINLAVKISITKFQEELKSCHYKSQRDEFRSWPKVVVWDETVSPALMKLLAEFPLHSTDQISAKNEERHSLLDAEITEIFLKFRGWVQLPVDITNRFLPYIEMLLVEAASDGKQDHAEIREKHLLSFIPYIAELISQYVSDDWRYRLLQAFTQAFKAFHPESRLKLACISAIDKMLIPETDTFLDPSDPAHLGNQIIWIRELPHLLIALGDKNPSSTDVVLRLIDLVGGKAPIHPSFLLEYEELKTPFQAFFSTSDAEGNICYGPFLRLPPDCQWLSTAPLSKFARVDVPLLREITRCCLCDDLDPHVLFSIVDDLGRAKNIQLGDCLGFFITLLSRLKVVIDITEKEPDEEMLSKISSIGTLLNTTKIIRRCLFSMGDAHVLLQVLEEVIVGQLLEKPGVANARSLLEVILTLDSNPTRLSEGSIAALGDFLPVYMLDAVRQTPIGDGRTAETADLIMELRYYYLRPCFFLFGSSPKLVDLVLKAMGQLADDSSRIVAILEVILAMQKKAFTHQILLSFQSEIGSILQRISHLQASDENKMTLQQRHKVQLALDQLRGL